METFPDPFSVKVWFTALSLSFKNALQHTSILKNRSTVFCNLEVLKITKTNNLNEIDVGFI